MLKNDNLRRYNSKEIIKIFIIISNHINDILTTL